MKKYLYFQLIPESLIASMIPPDEFGNYLAIGTKKRMRGQAMFFEVDPDFDSDYFPLEDIEKKCVPHPDGKPKHSLYLSIYRVLEHLPLKALENLYLATDDGRVLCIEPQKYEPAATEELHLYQEICPVIPRIASHLNPLEFCRLVTNPENSVSVPRLVFAELMLDGLSTDPVHAADEDLPYPHIDHLRDVLTMLQARRDKPTKTVIRYWPGEILYRTIKNGFFVGDQETLLYYPLPSKTDMENKYFTWWRSALTVHFGNY